MSFNEFARTITKEEKEQGRKERRIAMRKQLEQRELVEEALEAYEDQV